MNHSLKLFFSIFSGITKITISNFITYLSRFSEQTTWIKSFARKKLSRNYFNSIFKHTHISREFRSFWYLALKFPRQSCECLTLALIPWPGNVNSSCRGRFATNRRASESLTRLDRVETGSDASLDTSRSSFVPLIDPKTFRTTLNLSIHHFSLSLSPFHHVS